MVNTDNTKVWLRKKWLRKAKWVDGATLLYLIKHDTPQAAHVILQIEDDALRAYYTMGVLHEYSKEG